MMAAILRVTALVFVLCGAGAVAAQATGEEAALTRLIEQWAVARNAHDAEAMRSIFDLDVDQIRLSDGEVIATDQDGLVRWFEAGFKRDGKASTARVDSTRVRVLSPGVGLVDFGFTLLGTGGQTLATGHTTFVCSKRDDGWRVTALRFASTAPK